MTTQSEINSILTASEERASKATPGPWKRRKKWRSDRKALQIYPDDRSVKKPFIPSEIANLEEHRDEALANAVFIAHARTDLPRANAALRVLMNGITPTECHYIGDNESTCISRGVAGCDGCHNAGLLAAVLKILKGEGE